MNYTLVTLTPREVSTRPGTTGRNILMTRDPVTLRGRIKFVGGREARDGEIVIDETEAEIRIRLLPSTRDCGPKWGCVTARGTLRERRWDILRALEVGESRNTWLVLRVRLSR